MCKRIALSTVLFGLFMISMSTAQTPVKILTQPLMDRFLADMPPVMSDPLVSSKWDASTQMVLMEAITNPSSGIMMGSSLFDDIYSMQKAICQKMKADSGVAAVVAKKGWKSEFWDVYLVMAIGLPYAHSKDIQNNQDLSGLAGALDFSEMPPYTKYLHPDDMTLIQKNYSTINGLIGEEIAQRNSGL